MARQKKGFQPMLACKAPDRLADVNLPIWASRKLDGIRCVIRNGEPLSRTLKPIQNKHIRDMLRALDLPALDGELMLADPLAPFSEVSSAIMSGAGWPDFRYHVFDCHTGEGVQTTIGLDVPYWRRYAKVKECVEWAGLPLVLVSHWQVDTPADLELDEASVVEEGYEGLMLRGIQSPYKYGRSTLREGWLMKVKRFLDSEAEVIGLVELMRNENDLEVNEVGYAKRSTAKSGMVPAGTLGALQCRWNGVDFEIGTGFSAAKRDVLWEAGDQLLGARVKFKYQGIGTKGRPRFPVFLGSRHKDDG